MGRLCLLATIFPAAMAAFAAEAAPARLCRAPESPYLLHIAADSGSATLMEERGSVARPLAAFGCRQGSLEGARLRRNPPILACVTEHQSTSGYAVELGESSAVVYIRNVDGAFPIAELFCR